MQAVVVLLVLALSVIPVAKASDRDRVVVGRALVLDGDSISIGGVRIRIYGIDAPEGAQRCRRPGGVPWSCGAAATEAMRSLTQGRPLRCEGRGLDDYGRLLAVCRADGVDIGAELVRRGLAWAFVRYSNVYVSEEAQARAARRGVFAADNQPPWEFRASRWQGAHATAASDRARACPIKGNINRRGERIYHMPWQSSYARTLINERRGERWFCTVLEAEQAGWRAAR
jgi:endonuclease YncB( thermonuclease family)